MKAQKTAEGERGGFSEGKEKSTRERSVVETEAATLEDSTSDYPCGEYSAGEREEHVRSRLLTLQGITVSRAQMPLVQHGCRIHQISYLF
jgi:hypothetical protein